MKKYLFELPSKSEDEAATALDLTLLKDVSKFISYYKAGKLSPKMKRYSKKQQNCVLFACLYTHIDQTFFSCVVCSESIPTPNDGPVTIVVGKTFDTFVAGEENKEDVTKKYPILDGQQNL